MAKETVLVPKIIIVILYLNSAHNFTHNERRIFKQDSFKRIIDQVTSSIIGDKGVLDQLTNIMPVNKAKQILKDFNLGKKNPDINLNIIGLLNKYGHSSVSTYQVETEDGYILTLYRLKGPRDPVFLMHGMTLSADDFVTPGPESGLAYLLAAEGFDVWLGNARGNVHSRKHKRLSPDSAEFWQFSWDEIGLYDLPAMIDFVLGETGRSQLKYVGHSQGTTSFFVMCSMKPEYNKKISIMVALSAVAYMSRLKSPIIRLMSPLNPLISVMARLVGMNEFIPRHGLIAAVEKAFCGTKELALIFCNTITLLLGGLSFRQTNVTNLPLLYRHTPAGASVRQLLHYGQGVVSGKFRRYDYGFLKNLVVYKSTNPPSYPVQQITAPVAIFYSVYDWMASKKDVFKLIDMLPNVVDVYKVPCEPFNHMDFVWAKDSKSLIFHKLLHLFELY